MDDDIDDEMSRMGRDAMQSLNVFFGTRSSSSLRSNDSRSAGLEPLDNRTLGRNQQSDSFFLNSQIRNTRKRGRNNTNQNNDSPFMPDDDVLEENIRARKRKANETVNWNYVSPKEYFTKEDEAYESSCDELEEEEHEEECESEHEHSLRRCIGDDDEVRQPVSSEEDGSHSPTPPEIDERDEEGEEAILNMPESLSVPVRTKKVVKKMRRCFACDYQKGASVDVNMMNKCLTIIDDNYGTRSNLSLARTVHLFFKNEIYLKAGGSIPMWRTQTIKEHIEEHTLEPRLFIGESIRAFKSYATMLNGMMLRNEVNEAGDSHIVCNDRIMKCILDVHKRIIELYRVNPKDMNFYNEDCKINFDTIGKMVNLNKNWQYKNE